MKIHDTTTVYAAADGEVIPLSEVNDEAFSSGMLGEGFAVRPSGGTVYSPVEGTVEGIAAARHAYNIRSDSGLDVLVHIGIDTVNLGGDGFTPAVRIGDKVRAGDVIARADVAKVRGAGYDPVIPVLIANSADLGQTQSKLRCGPVRGGKSAVMTVRAPGKK